MDTEDAVMGDPAESPLADPFIIARFEKFLDGGVERKSLGDWLNGSSKAAQAWVLKARAVKSILHSMDDMKLSLTVDDINNFKGLLGIQYDIRKTFSSQGVEPEVLKTLFGDPREYHVKPWARVRTIRCLIFSCRSHNINILIGMCHLSTHSTLLNSLKSSDINTAAKIESYDLATIPYLHRNPLTSEN